MPLPRQRVKEKQVRILYEPVTVFGERSTRCTAQSLNRNFRRALRGSCLGRLCFAMIPKPGNLPEENGHGPRGSGRDREQPAERDSCGGFLCFSKLCRHRPVMTPFSGVPGEGFCIAARVLLPQRVLAIKVFAMPERVCFRKAAIFLKEERI